MAGFLSKLNLGRIAKVIALLLFVLPWVTVSCADQTFVSLTGVDLATGHVSVMAAPMGGPSLTAPTEHPNLFVILAALLIVAGLVLTFVLRGAKGAMAAAGCAALAALLLAYTMFVEIQAKARADAAASAGGSGSGAPPPEQLAELIRVNIQIGFYLCLAALIAAVVLDLLAMKESAPPAVAAPPPSG